MKEQGIRKISFLFLILFLTSLLLFFLDRQGWVSPVKSFLSRPVVWMEKGIFQGYQDLVKSITSITGSTSIKSTKREEEIFRLEGKLRQLAVEQNQLNSCLEENEKIKKLLGAPLPANWKFMEARVVGISEKMRIDKGEKDGVKEGMMVISENILVGKVVKANENDALVQLLSDANLKMSVLVKKPSPDKTKALGGIQARGLLFGQGGEKLLLDRVLQSEDIRKGDLVVTVGEEGWLPDLLVGQIVDVAPKTAEVYQRARVSPLIDYQNLRIVFLVVK